MCESGNSASGVFSCAACIFTRRAYITRAACIFTRFEDDNALARIKPRLNALETTDEYSKKLHRGKASHTDVSELHGIVARTPSLAGGC